MWLRTASSTSGKAKNNALLQPLRLLVERASVPRGRLAQLDALKETGEETFRARRCTIARLVGRRAIGFYVDLLPDDGLTHLRLSGVIFASQGTGTGASKRTL